MILFGSLLGVIIVDQLSKWAVLSRRLPVVYNTGGAWGIAQSFDWYGVLVGGVLCAAILYVFYKRVFSRPLWIQLCMGLLLGGGLSNFIDRWRVGSVIDWITIGDWFPWFNIADVAISTSVVLWLLLSYFKKTL